MANPALVKMLMQGSKVWNRWREQHPEDTQLDLRGAILSKVELIQANLRGANLQRADLSGANLSEADLQGAPLSNAMLNKAILSGADLRNANLNGAFLDYATLSHANLQDARLHNAHLNYANLSNADLRAASLNGANLSGADLKFVRVENADWTGVTLGAARLDNIDLRGVIGLETVRHIFPSIISIDTIYLSHSQIPESFLRGVGVPEPFIANMRALVDSMSPTEFYSCFISYSHQNEDFAKRLHADLQDKGVRCWFAPHDMKIGDKLRPRIDEAIHLQDKLLLILSKDSVASDWVEHEVETALARESKEKRTILFPIRVDNAILEREYTGWAALVQNERNIGNFTHWADPQAYNQVFEQLLRDFKAEKEQRERRKN